MDSPRSGAAARLDQRQILPVGHDRGADPSGANPVNMALYVGLQLRGGAGAAVAVFGMLIPAFCTTLILGALYRNYGHLAVVHFVLAGMAAAGVGATLTMGIKVARRLPRNLVTALIAVAVFVLVGVLRWPMIPVVAVMVPLSIGLAFVAEKRARSCRERRPSTGSHGGLRAFVAPVVRRRSVDDS